MAEVAVAAQEYGTGLQRLDILDVLPDGWEWGTLDLADVANGKMWIITVNNLTVEVARRAVRQLWEPAQIGDPEWLDPDPADRRIKRGLREVKAFVDELPQPKRDELAATGRTTLSLGQAQSIFRKQQYNRVTGKVEDSGIGEFG